MYIANYVYFIYGLTRECHKSISFYRIYMLICFENLIMDKILPCLIILGCYLNLTIAWCPLPNNALEDLVHFADVVVVGTVSQIIPDPSPSTYEEPSYGAKIDVRCSYKGGLFPRRIPGTITIGEAGETKAFCCCCCCFILRLRYVPGDPVCSKSSR